MQNFVRNLEQAVFAVQEWRLLTQWFNKLRKPAITFEMWKKPNWIDALMESGMPGTYNIKDWCSGNTLPWCRQDGEGTDVQVQ